MSNNNKIIDFADSTPHKWFFGRSFFVKSAYFSFCYLFLVNFWMCTFVATWTHLHSLSESFIYTQIVKISRSSEYFLFNKRKPNKSSEFHMLLPSGPISKTGFSECSAGKFGLCATPDWSFRGPNQWHSNWPLLCKTHSDFADFPMNFYWQKNCLMTFIN